MKTTGLVTLNGALVELPKPPAYAKLGKRGRQVYETVGRQLIEIKLLQPADLFLLLHLATQFDEWDNVNTAIQEKEKVERLSGYIQTFKSNASNVSAEFSVREKIMAEIKSLAKEYLMTPRARLLAKNGTVGMNQVSFDFDDIRQALNSPG
jgi:phage terminase small subunit